MAPISLKSAIAYFQEQKLNIPIAAVLAATIGIWVLFRLGVVIYRLYMHPLSNFPGPRLAAATSLYEMYFDIYEGGTFTWKMDELHAKYGPIVRTGPEKLRLRKSSAFHEIHCVGSKFLKDEQFYEMFQMPKTTFATINPEEHRQKRSLISPTFSRRGILELEALVQDKVAKLCRRLKQHEDEDRVVDIYGALGALTTDVVTEVAYGRSYDILDDTNFTSGIIDTMDSQVSMLMIWKHFPFLARLTANPPFWMPTSLLANGAGYRRLTEDAYAQLDQILARMRAGDLKAKASRSIFGGILAEHPDPENADRGTMMQEAGGLVGAGAQTTRWCLAVGLLEVATEPEIQRKLYEELRDAHPDMAKPLPFVECERLPYLRGVVLESLRYGYGIIGGFPRRVPREGAIVAGYHLPGNTTIEMDVYSIHHDEEIFPDSRRFMPERWLSPDSRQNEKYVVSFGAGSRQCVGMGCEIYLVLATIFRRFEVDVSARGGKRLEYKDRWSPILTGEPVRGKVISRKD